MRKMAEIKKESEYASSTLKMNGAASMPALQASPGSNSTTPWNNNIGGANSLGPKGSIASTTSTFGSPSPFAVAPSPFGGNLIFVHRFPNYYNRKSYYNFSRISSTYDDWIPNK